MRVLGIETSGDVAGIALVDEKGTLAELSFRHRMDLSRFLAPRIQELLAVAGLALEEVEGMAVAVGPGSFTGLRIGVTAAKALAYARGLPVAGISTLEALTAAHPAPRALLVCAVLSASASDLFAGFYRWSEAGPEPLEEERLIPAAELADRLAQSSGETLLTGHLGPHRPLLRGRLGGRIILSVEDEGPRAATVARLGRARLLAGGGEPAHALAPRYLRASAAEVRRKEATCPTS